MTQVLDEIVVMLVEVVGEDFLLGVEVGPQTTFNDDLALESIEFVALSEKLHRRFGERADLAGYLAGMDLEEIMAMTVGDLAAHIESRLPAAVG